MTQVAIIVVSYNTRGLLLECLASVIDSTNGAEVELVVVDNASQDGSLEAARKAYPEAITIGNQTNLGFGAACNQGIRATSSPLVLLLNSDARLTREAFCALSDCLTSSVRCAAAGCRLINAEGREKVNTRNFLTPLNHALEQAGISNRFPSRYLRRTHRPRLDRKLRDCSVDWIDGACLMLSRAALDQVGLFDERFFMYSEDEDLCFRLRKVGWSVCFSAAGTAIHHGGASSARNRLEMLRHFYLSQLLFLAKHRGRASVFFYAAAMKTTLTIKRLLLPLRSKNVSREELIERLAALRQARASKHL